MPTLDSRNLEVFIAVAELLSFSLASERLNITQPAVSKRIALLERQIGQPLFERYKKQVQLSEAGRVLLPLARKIVADIDEALQHLIDLGETVSGSLSIAISHHVGLHRLPPFLKQFRASYPEVKLDIQFVDSDQGYRRVLEGDSELAVITLERSEPEELNGIPLWRDPLAFVCSFDHELHLEDNVSIQRLASLDAILLPEKTYTRFLIDELFRQQKLTPKLAMSTSNLETIKEMVSIGLGWSVLPRSMSNGLEEIPVSDVYLERSLGIVTNSKRTLSRAADSFKNLLTNS